MQNREKLSGDLHAWEEEEALCKTGFKILEICDVRLIHKLSIAAAHPFRTTELDDATSWWIVGRFEAGQSQAICSRDFGVSRNVVSTLWKQFTETRTVAHRPGQGHKKGTSTQDHYLGLLATRDRSARATYSRSET
ncbi:HTH_Tnp_Tc3_2 domain-containing protein [Trichonephila clavipes]|nr:HTH_Tnp_Tc3_2 domain-containing protein [Trichonephila clavipes]